MPAVSGGMNARSRVHASDSPNSTSPANMVMPQSSGMPPILTARIEGAR